MTELKNVEQELSRFNTRLLAAAAFVLLGFGLIAARLVHLQIVKHEELSTQAENNRIAVVPIVPNRGLILDRNGAVLAHNYAAYTLEITPSKAGALDPLIGDLGQVVEIAPKDRKRFRKLLEEGHDFASLPIRTRLSDEEVARFAANKYRFPGVDIRARLFRHYPNGEVGSHVLGYIGRLTKSDMAALEKLLVEKRIFGAGLDVFAEEPLQAKSALRKASNVVMTPHVAYNSTATSRRLVMIGLHNILNFRAGQPTNIVV